MCTEAAEFSAASFVMGSGCGKRTQPGGKERLSCVGVWWLRHVILGTAGYFSSIDAARALDITVMLLWY